MLQEPTMPDFLFLPSNIKMRPEMGSTAGQCSSTGNTNTGKTLPPPSPCKHTHMYTGMYAHTNPEQTMREKQGDLGAPHAVMTNLEHRHLWRETFNRSVPWWEAPAATARAALACLWSSPSCLQVKPTALYTSCEGDCWWANRPFFFKIKFFSHNSASYPKCLGGRGRKADKFSSACLLHKDISHSPLQQQRGDLP